MGSRSANVVCEGPDVTRNTIGALFSLLALSACAISQASDAQNDTHALSEAGHRVALLKCARCHAVELAGESRNPSAPPFREVSRSVTIMATEANLREGIRIGHLDMPPVHLTRPEIDGLTAYLRSLQSESMDGDAH